MCLWHSLGEPEWEEKKPSEKGIRTVYMLDNSPTRLFEKVQGVIEL